MADTATPGVAGDALEAAINKAMAIPVEIGDDDAADDDDAPEDEGAKDSAPAGKAAGGSDGDAEASGDEPETEEPEKPAEAKPEPEDDAGRLKKLAKARRLIKTDPLAAAKLVFGDDVKELKLDSKKWAEFRRQSTGKERQVAEREQRATEAENRVRNYVDSVKTELDARTKSREAYEAGDFDLAMKLAFGLETANDFYKAHRAKVEGRDPRVSKLQKETEELRKKLEAKERGETEAQHAAAEQQKIDAYITGLGEEMAELGDAGIAAASKVAAFRRDVYRALDAEYRAGRISGDDAHDPDVLSEVAQKVFDDGGWSEVISGETPSAHRGAKPAKRGRVPRSINSSKATEVPAPGARNGKLSLEDAVSKWAPRVNEELRRETLRD